MQPIIAISGVDCAGKSTQIELLANALRARGHVPEAVWFRPGYSSVLDAARAFVRRLRPGALPTVAEAGARDTAFRRPVVRRAWLAMARADTLVHYGALLRAMRAGGKTVVSDRYIDDALLDLSLRFPDLLASRDEFERVLRRLCPEPDHSFLLWLPHDEMLQRMKRKREPFPDPPERRDRRFREYERLAGSGRFQVIDATRPIEAVHEAILAAVLD